MAKEHIVAIQWETWDRSLYEPQPDFPAQDLGSLLDSLPHDAESASKMEDLWELVLPIGAEADICHEIGRFGPEVVVVNPSSVVGDSLFVTSGKYCFIVTKAVKNWLERTAGEWTSFSDVAFERPRRANSTSWTVNPILLPIRLVSRLKPIFLNSMTAQRQLGATCV